MADAQTLDPGAPVLAETALADRVSRPAPALVLFYADWCPFCKAFVPTFRAINEDAGPPDGVHALAANLSHPEDPRWGSYAIETIPTVVAYADGEEVDRLEAVAGEGLDGTDYRGFLDRLDEHLT